MEIRDDGEPRVYLADSKGQTRAAMGLGSSSGSAMSILFDDVAIPCIGLFGGPNGETDLVRRDANGALIPIRFR